MQDKTKLDYMAKKYKEEMMRLYSMKRAAVPDAEPDTADDTVNEALHEPEPTAVPIEKNHEEHHSEINEKKTVEKKFIPPQNGHAIEMSARQMIPPMPKIPADYGIGAEDAYNPHTVMHTESKFPSAEEIMNAEQEEHVQAVTYQPQLKSEEDMPHHQGNYNYDAPKTQEISENYSVSIVPKADYPDEDTDFEKLFNGDESDSSPANMDGIGYLQIEVRTGDSAMPVDKAAVIVTQETNGQSYLITMKLTDSSGTTEVISLPAPSAELSEAPDPSERPFSEYNVAVYKKGFYTVPEVTVPIFDTIKSIQPVALIPLAEQDLQGYRMPNGGADNA